MHQDREAICEIALMDMWAGGKTLDHQHAIKFIGFQKIHRIGSIMILRQTKGGKRTDRSHRRICKSV